MPEKKTSTVFKQYLTRRMYNINPVGEGSFTHLVSETTHISKQIPRDSECRHWMRTVTETGHAVDLLWPLFNLRSSTVVLFHTKMVIVFLSSHALLWLVSLAVLQKRVGTLSSLSNNWYEQDCAGRNINAACMLWQTLAITSCAGIWHLKRIFNTY